jgi:hypothetical protein
MCKPILIDLSKHQKNKWIKLPQGTRIHPFEIKTIIDAKMDIGDKEYAIAILNNGKIIAESTGSETEVELYVSPKYKNYTITHTHPLTIKNNKISSHHTLPSQDLNNSLNGMRSISPNTDLKSYQIHDFTFALRRDDVGDHLIKEIHNIMDSKKLKRYNVNISTQARFNLSKYGFGYTSIIHAKIYNDRLYITKIKSTYPTNPHVYNPSYQILKRLK